MYTELSLQGVRRKKLIELLQKEHPTKQGALLIPATFESEREPLYQDSTFTYFVGLQEPAVMWYQELDGEAQLYEPAYTLERFKWVPVHSADLIFKNFGVKEIKKLGVPIPGCVVQVGYEKEHAKNLIKRITSLVKDKKFLFVVYEDSCPDVRFVLYQLIKWIPELKDQLIDISYLAGSMRRTKSNKEIEYLYQASEITKLSQHAASSLIKPNLYEYELQAAIEYVYTESDATRAFASVVASGPNSVILHYVDNNRKMQDGDMVVIDIGASYNHYCADVTRTYPVSGSFTSRQREIYQLVLETQQYIVDVARPGMYLNNPKEPEKSLDHLAKEFLRKRGYKEHMPHGIGHFIGLDVHDVGDRLKPLQKGDVITIEPGIYLPKEDFGVRIEDMYWIIDDGVICLTESIPKQVDEIQESMKRVLHEDEAWKNDHEKNVQSLSEQDQQD